MSLRHALLGMLEDGPASGYTLTTRFERSLQQYAWTARQSHIYPELKRMAADGLITVADEGARGRRSYAITDAGREELRAWLLSPPKARAIRDEHALRMCLLSGLGAPEARQQVLRHLREAEQVAAELESLARAADADPHPRGRLRMGRLALQYGIFHYQAQQQWARWALDQLDQAPGDHDQSGR
jgi:PadR family transcriptional regulator, regulatory protein AphA